MRVFEKALIAALKAQAILVSLTKYSASNLSIAMANPTAGVLRPGLFAEVDSDPMDADAGALLDSDVTLYAIGTEKGEATQIRDAVDGLFFDPTTQRAKKFDISDSSVVCIGSWVVTRQNSRRNEDLDLFEAPIVVRIRWGLKRR